MADVKIGLFLSGGLDSNLIARILYKKTKQKIITFSAIIDDKELQEENNTDTVEQINNSIKDLDNNRFEKIFIHVNYEYINKNFVNIISNNDNPILDTSGLIVMFSLAEAARLHNCKVILSGVGGDECFGGYNWQSRYKNNSNFMNRTIYNLSKLNFLTKFINNRIFNYIFFPFFYIYQVLVLNFLIPKISILNKKSKFRLKNYLMTL